MHYITLFIFSTELCCVEDCMFPEHFYFSDFHNYFVEGRDSCLLPTVSKLHMTERNYGRNTFHLKVKQNEGFEKKKSFYELVPFFQKSEYIGLPTKKYILFLQFLM